ncbi:MAG: hypothetical protein D6689_21940 [Deltaproteobacteria bacterium]|nr:MAG: hypothetical protein D6689_21940 [Deltaproteobacteria bacterium]
MTRAAAIAAAIAAVAAPRAARADAQEASIHVELLAGRIAVADPGVDRPAASAAAGGVGVRATLATHDAFAYELAVRILQGGDVRYGGVAIGGREGELSRTPRAFRAAGGLTLRLGARTIPTVSVWAGGQLRTASGGRIVEPSTGAVVGDIGGATATDVVAGGSLGFDYRIDRHWIVGIAAGGGAAIWSSAGSYREITALAHVSYYGYPRWF